jgi:5-methylcytosine-specific restriction enzyme subunit McrC
MASLFEEFVRNFFKIEQSYYCVSREDIRWNVTGHTTEEEASFLPKMQTDISLESIHKKIIIDTKYYREALTEHYDKEKIRSENLYQMFAYLQNLDTTNEHNKTCTGILLYPTVTKDLNMQYVIHDHRISFKTINLNQNWKNIHKDLLAIVEL